MNTSDLLEQLLRAGQASLNSQGGASPQSRGGPAGLGGLGGLLGGLLGSGGAAAGGGGLGGLLGGLLGGSGLGGATPQGRTSGNRYAALASLGMMAFQAYQAWQQQQASNVQSAAVAPEALRTVDLLAGPEAEAHSHAILRALIAAAKADGRIDEQEQQLISSELGRHTDDPDLQQWLDAEVARPLDAADVAQAADGPGMAAEMYLASVMLVDQQQAAERNYLDELAAALGIEPELQLHLEQQARGGAA